MQTVVELKHLRPWSFSKVQIAKRCQLEFFWRYVEKKEPLKKPDFMLLGSGVHFVLENALMTLLKRKKPLNMDVIRYFGEVFRREEPRVEFRKLADFFPNILRYVNGQLRRMEEGETVIPELCIAVDRNMNFLEDFNSPSAFLRGKLDFVFSRGPVLYIVDHKTSRAKGIDNRMKTQLRWYALLAGIRFPEAERFVLEIHNVRYGTVSRFSFSRRELYAFKARLIPIVDMVEESLLGKTLDDLVPTPDASNCRWCDYRHVCSASK